MATKWQRNWTAQIVIASEHAGLRPIFKRLENELYHALAHMDEPTQVREYIMALRVASMEWREANSFQLSRK